MAFKYLLLAATVSALALVACGGEEKTPEQNQGQVTSPGSPNPEPGVEEMIVVDEFPTPTNTVNPVYPEDARKNGIEGTVWLKVLVTKEGKVAKTVVSQRNGGSESMERAAIDAVKQWTFKPATIKLQPVAIWVSVPFKFKLADKK